MTTKRSIIPCGVLEILDSIKDFGEGQANVFLPFLRCSALNKGQKGFVIGPGVGPKLAASFSAIYN